MADYIFPELTFGWPEKTGTGSWLWIWNADRVPPHIGISQGQHYFSLTYRGSEIRKNVATMARKAKRTAIPLVLVELSDWPFEQDFATVFQQYDRAKVGGPTCLTPVKEVLGLTDGVSQLAELLTEIEKHLHLKQVFAVNLNRTYRGIPDYTVSEIMSRIELLHETQRSESTIAPR